MGLKFRRRAFLGAVCHRRVSNLSRRCRVCFIVMKSALLSWNPPHRPGTRFVVVGSSSSSLDLHCHRWIFVVVVEPTFLVSNLGGVVALFVTVAWCSVQDWSVGWKE